MQKGIHSFYVIFFSFHWWISILNTCKVKTHRKRYILGDVGIPVQYLLESLADLYGLSYMAKIDICKTFTHIVFYLSICACFRIVNVINEWHFESWGKDNMNAWMLQELGYVLQDTYNVTFLCWWKENVYHVPSCITLTKRFSIPWSILYLKCIIKSKRYAWANQLFTDNVLFLFSKPWNLCIEFLIYFLKILFTTWAYSWNMLISSCWTIII